MGDINFRQLLEDIEAALYEGESVEDPAAFLASLQAAKPAFLNLLRYKVNAGGAGGAFHGPPDNGDRPARPLCASPAPAGRCQGQGITHTDAGEHGTARSCLPPRRRRLPPVSRRPPSRGVALALALIALTIPLHPPPPPHAGAQRRVAGGGAERAAGDAGGARRARP